MADPRVTLASMELAAAELMAERERVEPEVWARPLPPLAELEADWRRWVWELFPTYVSDREGQPIPFGEHHIELWTWLWCLRIGQRPSPFIGIWGRGGAKSTTAELGAVAIGSLGRRKYGLYICDTQDQADDHVANVGTLLEKPRFARAYPEMANRLVGKYRHSRGWRRNRLRTRSRFTLDGMGLDSASRGAKLDEMKPDLIFLDDVDRSTDSPSTTSRKIKLLSREILPAGTPDCAVLGIQNLIHPDGVFARLADRRADFLQDRYLSGPLPALRDFAYELRKDAEGHPKYFITSGIPTWEGQNVARCQALMDTIGLTAFRVEAQHEVHEDEKGMFGHIQFRHCTWDQVPTLVKIVVAVDPAVTATDDSDAHGIQAEGLGVDGLLYRLFSWEDRASPEAVLKRAIYKAIELKASEVVVETDQGGDLWRGTFYRILAEVDAELKAEWAVEHADALADPDPRTHPTWPGVRLTFESQKAGSIGSKAHRGSLMLVDYEHGQIIHVLGTHEPLERGLKRFLKRKPFDLVDASFWSWFKLRHGPRPRARNPAA